MTPKDSMQYMMSMADQVMTAYLDGLSDADLMLRPVPGMNHIAWQLGHLIGSEHRMMSEIGASMPDLPDGFVEAHSPESATSDDPKKFFAKQQYQDWMAQQRAASLKALAAASDADLDKPTPEEMHAYAKTAGEVFTMAGAHVMMHVGQFVAVRRKLGKPIAI